MCKYCEEKIKQDIKKNKDGILEYYGEPYTVIDGEIIQDREFKRNRGGNYTDIRIQRPKNAKKTRLTVDNGYGISYIEINYCFMCGRKLDE